MRNTHEENLEERISMDVDKEVFSELLLNDSRYAADCNIRDNRNFAAYDIKQLEACSKNAETKHAYTQKELKEDLTYFFDYLPTTEVNRLVNTIFWLLKEGLKNYGNLTINDFGKFSTYDRPYKIRYNVSTGQLYSVPYMKLRRVIDFNPSENLKRLLTPRDMKYMRVTPTGVEKKEFPDLFSSFAQETKHRRQGQILMQKAFDETFRFLGYSDSYLSAIYNHDI